MELLAIKDDLPFEQRLAEAIAWCAPRADLNDPEGSLRHSQLRPSVLATSRAQTVLDVVRTRASYRETRDSEPVRAADQFGGGRLLIYVPDEQLADGAAEAETGGFFDVENVPAWDTWVGLFHDQRSVEYLVSWVPAPLVELVGRGIRVNPEQCIRWLADTGVPLAHELRSRGLLDGRR